MTPSALTPSFRYRPLLRTVAGVVIAHEMVKPSLPLGRRVAELSRLGLHVVLLGGDLASTFRSRLRPEGPGRVWIVDQQAGVFELTAPTEEGVDPTPSNGDAGDLALALLAREGVTGRLVLVLSDHGSAERILPQDSVMSHLYDALDEQITRAHQLRVPTVDDDDGWIVVEAGVDAARHRVSESLFTLASGGVALRGSTEEDPAFGHPLVLAAGVYEGTGCDDSLLPGPDVVDVDIRRPVETDRRVLDLRSGVLLREEVGQAGTPLRSLRFASAVLPGVFAMRVETEPGRLATDPHPRTLWRQNEAPDSGGIGAAIDIVAGGSADVATEQRIIAVEAAASDRPARSLAQERLAHAARRGFDQLLADQRAAWADRWQAVDVRIPADPESERALRFALFQLWGMSCAPRSSMSELAIGARGLTGAGYRGHVFWDSDVFVLPAMATIHPPSADAMVAYRYRRLAAAQKRARAEGRRGARFPWESARDGTDVTPREGYIGGEPVPVLTGLREEHITADVAWAAAWNATWSRPDAHLTNEETTLLTETARYWESRARRGDDGLAHIEGVIGPDEYHEHVDDNAFTNGMARWNLRAAARRAEVPPEERAGWVDLADTLVDGYDPVLGVHEQFSGYFGLEPIVVADHAQPPVAADVLLGRGRTSASQIVKQPDVLMLHHLVPRTLRRGSMQSDLDFYLPRTAHGSSLSLNVTAAVAARAKSPDLALALLRLGLRTDLDDLGGASAAGVHVGACGGAWQAIVVGFLGARVVDGMLELDPVLPAAWPSLEVRFRCLGRDVRVNVDDTVSVTASSPLCVHLAGERPGVAGPHVRLIQGVEQWQTLLS